MKSLLKTTLVLFAALVLVAGTVGCQSGFKMRNPFSKEPKASSANPPSELDELDDLTPPPENYTLSDAKDKTDDSESIVQKGKYEVEESTSKLAPKEEMSVAVDAAPAEPAQEPFAPQSTFAANSAPTNNEPASVPAATPNEAQTYATLDGARANPQPVDPYMTPYVAPNAALARNDVPAANPYPAPQNDFPTAQAFTPGAAAPVQNNDFPVVSNPYPVDATAQNPAPVGRVESVAMNYDPTPAPVADAPAANAYSVDSDPYSGIVYEPQTTSTGFAPGSTALY
ncbi:MAG: hypothetical protein IJM54_06070 [Thermoguttaceae bacterium]|nr:hypothetical protein [Thermoguttaceae bacterium]MBR4751177.1 hypothetical protein [Thermoguttaceae bacterium]